jgi:DNA ligase D-like protein (predicted 3'-phosphoesterase)
VHEHWSRTHHFDFRLEMDGVLKSWAVPKGPPTTPSVKRLAIAVADHSLQYGSFEGIIPRGRYGAGRVAIWDIGNYSLKKRGKQEIQFELFGEKLQGYYELLFIKKDRNREQWLLFKLSDKLLTNKGKR